MSDAVGGSTSQDLQFDHVLVPGAGSNAVKPAASCTACHRPIADEYYDINGVTVCGGCRVAVESAAQTPREIGTLLKAALFGLGAGIVGAAIYYAVIAIANLEIGIVAILIGYMVGYAVRRGAGNRGGRRFQILAVVLMYVSVAMAYTPLAIQGAVEASRKTEAAAVADGSTGAAPVASTKSDDGSSRGGGGIVIGLIFLIGLALALPVVVIVGSMPSGLISAAIIFFGMQQAWRMTRAPSLVVNGPYRVGGSAATTPA